jgi:hypothetical protein
VLQEVEVGRDHGRFPAFPDEPGLANDPAISQTPTANKNTTIHAAADSNMWLVLALGWSRLLPQD